VRNARDKVALERAEAELAIKGAARGGQSKDGRQRRSDNQPAEQQRALPLLGKEPSRVGEAEPKDPMRTARRPPATFPAR